MVILLFGPPSCGKGTQAPLISSLLRIPAISTGEMLRGECESKTDLGLHVQAILSSGLLVSDDLVNQVLDSRLRKPDCEGGFLLDGYPRTVPQAQYLDRLLERLGHPSPTVLSLTVGHEVLVRRACARRQCPKCHRIYNILFQPPRQEGICDADRTPLIRRADDSEEIVRQRLLTYDKVTAPVISYYAGRDYHEIPADRSPNEIFRDIESLLIGRLVESGDFAAVRGR